MAAVSDALLALGFNLKAAAAANDLARGAASARRRAAAETARRRAAAISDCQPSGENGGYIEGSQAVESLHSGSQEAWGSYHVDHVDHVRYKMYESDDI